MSEEKMCIESACSMMILGEETSEALGQLTYGLNPEAWIKIQNPLNTAKLEIQELIRIVRSRFSGVIYEMDLFQFKTNPKIYFVCCSADPELEDYGIRMIHEHFLVVYDYVLCFWGIHLGDPRKSESKLFEWWTQTSDKGRQEAAEKVKNYLLQTQGKSIEAWLQDYQCKKERR